MNAGRISPVAKPGSLFKTERKPGAKRDLAPDHLAKVRRCACLCCDSDPAGEAAHLRLGVLKGMGLKSDDRWTVPLCHACHMRQHRIGEIRFWLTLGLDPIRIATALYAEPNLEKMRAVVFAARERRK